MTENSAEGYRYHVHMGVVMCDICKQQIKIGQLMRSRITMSGPPVRDYHVACIEQAQAEVDPEQADFEAGHPQSGALTVGDLSRELERVRETLRRTENHWRETEGLLRWECERADKAERELRDQRVTLEIRTSERNHAQEQVRLLNGRLAQAKSSDDASFRVQLAAEQRAIRAEKRVLELEETVTQVAKDRDARKRRRK